MESWNLLGSNVYFVGVLVDRKFKGVYKHKCDISIESIMSIFQQCETKCQAGKLNSFSSNGISWHIFLNEYEKSIHVHFLLTRDSYPQRVAFTALKELEREGEKRVSSGTLKKSMDKFCRSIGNRQLYSFSFMLYCRFNTITPIIPEIISNATYYVTQNTGEKYNNLETVDKIAAINFQVEEVLILFVELFFICSNYCLNVLWCIYLQVTTSVAYTHIVNCLQLQLGLELGLG